MRLINWMWISIVIFFLATFVSLINFKDFEIQGDLNVLSEKKRRVDEEIMRKNHELSNITEKNWQFQLKVINNKMA
jgi:hypothetical protein